MPPPVGPQSVRTTVDGEGDADAGHVVANGVWDGDGDALQGVAVALGVAASAEAEAEAERLSHGEAMALGVGEATTYPEASHQP